MHTDPVCGGSVNADEAVVGRYGEQHVYFCSESCRYTFEWDPSDFLSDPNPEDDELLMMELALA